VFWFLIVAKVVVEIHAMWSFSNYLMFHFLKNHQRSFD